MPFVKNAVYEVILRLSDTIQKLKDSADPAAMKKELLDKDARTSRNLLSLIDAGTLTLQLHGETKEAIITEMVDMLAARGKLLDRGMVLADVLEREKAMSTGMEYGIALPHAKTDGIHDIAVAVGIKKEGVDFEAMDGQSSRLFIMVVSPKKASGPHVQFLAAIGAVLKDEALRNAIINARTIEEAVALLRKE
jgi:mannitol/fructose-specific phosphotransferase system IIA component (Ntr-type)